MTKKPPRPKRTCGACGIAKDARGGYYKDNKDVCRKCVNAGVTPANPFDLTEADINRLMVEDPAAVEHLLELSKAGAFLYEPQNYQLGFWSDFFADRYQEYLITAGNRLGKSQTAMCALARFALTKPNMKIVVATNTNSTISQTLKPKLFDSHQFKLPHKKYKGYKAYKEGAWCPPLIPQKFIKEFIKGKSGMDFVQLANGTEIRAIPYAADTADRYQGWVADAVFLDESLPPGTEGTLTEIRTRLLDRGGRLVVSATFLDASTEMIDWFTDIEEGAIPGGKKYQWSIKDAKHLDPDQVARYIAGIPEHLRGVKLHGELAARAGLVVPNHRECVIDLRDCPVVRPRYNGFEIDRHCQVLFGIDPAGGKARFAIAMAVLDTQTGHLYFLDSDRTETNQTVEKCVKSIAKLCDTYNIPRREGILKVVMDCAGDRGPLGSIREEFAKWMRHYGVRAKNTGWSALAAEKGNKNAKLDKMRNFFESGKCFIIKERCRKFIKELSYYAWDAKTGKAKKRGYIDICDASMYLINHMPKVSPKKHWSRIDYVEEFFREERDSFKTETFRF